MSLTRIETLPTSSWSSRVADLPRGQLVAALGPRQRRGVDADDDRERGLVDADHRQRPRVVGVGERLADRHLFHPGDGDDFARPGLLGADPLEPLGHVQLGDARPLDRAVGPAPGDRLPGADRPLVDPADRQPPDVRRGVEVGDVRLQRRPLRVGRAPGSAPASG